MKFFPRGSSPEAMLDWISQNGLVYLPYPDSMNCGDTDVEVWTLTIQGTVLDTLSRPVRSALVAITDSAGMTLTSFTDANGNYKTVGPWLNNALVRVSVNPKGFSNGPFSSTATILSSVNHGVIVMPPVSPTPIRL